MNFRQLRILRATVRNNFNLTEVASALFTAQSGVSKHIKDLEDELGVQIFERRGKRLLGLTEPGKEMLPIVERILLNADNIKHLGEQFAQRTEGRLIIAATHTQARYALPPVVLRFRQELPQVHLDPGRGCIDGAFAAAGLAPDIVMSALDADVIKSYVELGLGVGIIASMAFHPVRDAGLRLLACERLFAANTTRIALRRGHHLRDYAVRFVTCCAPALTPAQVHEGVFSKTGTE